MSPQKVGCAAFSLAGVAVVACIGKWLHDYSHELKSEYMAAAVIREVTKYVESHDGQWPRNWDDIPNGEDARDYVRVDFDIDLDDLVRDPERIQSTIVPATGRYRTYPHARRQLEELRNLMLQHHQSPDP